MSNDATGVLWRRLKYMLSPQFDIYKNISERVGGMRVYEVGFGTGFGTVLLASKAKTVKATEIDVSAVSFAKNVFPLQNITWVVGDITKGNNMTSYNAVVCLEVLEHIPDWRAALANLKEITGDGTLYISGPNANASLRKTDLHEREWTAKEFVAGLHEFFSKVQLFDYSMTEEQGLDTNLTPLLAICHA